MRRRRERETPEFAAMVRRMIRAHGRRCADADPEDLAELVDIAGCVDDAVTEAVIGLQRAGFSWAEIAAPLGITRQAAHLRYGAAVRTAVRLSTVTEAANG